MQSHTQSPQFRCVSGELTVVALEGRDAISEPYRFVLELASTSPDLPLEDIVGSRGALGLGGRTIHGVIKRFEQGDALGGGRYAYVAELVPWLALLDVGRQSRIFQGLAVPEIVMAVCAAYTGADAGAVTLRLSTSYRPRDYVVQYAESDLAFVSRLLEEEGISYHFEHAGEREALVLSDANEGFAVGLPLAYGAELDSLRCVTQTVPRRLVLTDQREDTPWLPLHAEAEVHARGVGLWAEDGARLADPEDAERVAAIRAEEQRGRQTTFFGRGTRYVAAGTVFSLTEHFRADFNRPMLVTSTAVRWSRGALAVDLELASATHDTFRPARTTPRPQVPGLMRARLDAEGPGEHADADASGRYRVVMPFDVNGGEALTPMPLSQPYGADGAGIHFPLPKGAEVVWGCIGGDPDRPVITGAVGKRSTRPVIEMSRPRKAARRDAPASFALSEQPHLSPTTEEVAFTESDTGSSTNDTWLRFSVPHAIKCGADFIQNKKTYLRIGERPNKDAADVEVAAVETEELLDINVGGSSKWDDARLWGVFDYTDGTRTVITRQDKEEFVGGKYRLVVQDGTFEMFDAAPYQMWFGKDIGGTYRKFEVSKGSESRWYVGDTENFYLGYQFDATVGLMAGIGVVGQINLTAGLDVTGSLMLSTSYVGGKRYEYTFGSSVSHAKTQDLKASKRVSLRIKPNGLGLKSGKVKLGMAVGAVAGAAAGALTGVLTDAKVSTSETMASDAGLIATGATVQGLALGAGGLLAAHTIMRSIVSVAAPSDPELVLQRGGITLKAGESRIILAEDSLLLKVGKVAILLNDKGISFHAASGKVSFATPEMNVDGIIAGAKIKGDLGELAMPPTAVKLAIMEAKLDLQKYMAEVAVTETMTSLDDVKDMTLP